jgi:hypothetical protein
MKISYRNSEGFSSIVSRAETPAHMIPVTFELMACT